MHDDDPDDVVHNLFAEQAYGAHTPLGRPIAGTVGSIEALTRGAGRAVLPAPLPARQHGRRRGRQPRPRRGRAAWCARRSAAAAGWRGDEPPVAAAPRRPSGCACTPALVEATRPFEQVNLVLGMEGVHRNDDRRFALGVLNTALGGGTSSRLFQEVRERRGLAYSVFSFASHHADSGLVGVSVGCLPNKLDEVLGRGPHRALPGRRPRHHRGGAGPRQGPAARRLVLGLEDSGSRMSRIGKAELVHDELLGIDEVMARIDAVTLDEVAPRSPRGLSRASPRSSRCRAAWLHGPVTGRRGPTRAVGAVSGGPMIPTTAGGFCSTTETRNPACCSAADVFSTISGTFSGGSRLVEEVDRRRRAAPARAAAPPRRRSRAPRTG